MDVPAYKRGFVPYALAAFLVGIVGGFSAVLGPAFVQDLGLDYNNTTWTALATTVSAAACSPILGRLADAAGRKRMLLAGIGIFGMGNLLTAMADSLAFMLGARLLVGIGMAAIAPVVMAYIVTEYPADEQGKGFALYMLLSSGAVIFGPTLGSLIIGTWGWRAMIWLCTALCAATLVVASLWREPDRPGRGSLGNFDTAGAVLAVVFFGLAICLPSVGQNLGWDSAAFRFCGIGAVAAGLALLRVESRREAPVLPLGFIGRRAFLLPVAALFLTQGLMQANMTNTIVFVNCAQPENTLVSGYAISVMYLGMALGSVFLGPLADRFAPRQVLTASLSVTAAGTALMFGYGTESSWLILLCLGIIGFGLGGNGTVLMKTVLAGVSREEAGTGTGTFGLFRDLAAPFGVAVLVPMFTNRITFLAEQGASQAEAAVGAIRMLAATELICLAAGIGVVRLFPKGEGKKT